MFIFKGWVPAYVSFHPLFSLVPFLHTRETYGVYQVDAFEPNNDIDFPYVGATEERG